MMELATHLTFRQSMKLCPKCAQTKPRSEFFAHGGICKLCEAIRRKDYYRAHHAEALASRKQHYEAHLKENANYRNRPEVRERLKVHHQSVEARRRKRERNLRDWALEPEKRKARVALSNAIQQGKIKRGPCADCGATQKIHGHHEDYSKPLDVIWLCGPCHRGRHSHR